MSELERGDETLLRELEEVLARSVPSSEGLAKALDAIAKDVELSRDEVNSVVRSLERVWHMMRLIRLLSEFFGDAVFFGGGAVLNYLYMVKVGEVPRFTFDVDATWRKPARAKREVLAQIPLFNKWLVEKGYSLKLPVGSGRSAYLWVVEYDVEKDHFPGVLSLRVPVLTRYTGEPFYRFLELRDYATISRLREVFQGVLGVRDPLVDYVRFEISLGMADAPAVRVSTTDFFGNTLNVLITEPELQLAWKILGKIGKYYEDPSIVLHDVLKAVLDLRLAKHLDTSRIRSYVVTGENTARVADNARRNLEVLRERGEELWRGHHYVLVRKKITLEEAIRSSFEFISVLLFDATPGRGKT